MAKRKSTGWSNFRQGLLTFVLAVAIPWGPGLLGCEFEPSAIGRHPPVDDEDAGDDAK